MPSSLPDLYSLGHRLDLSPSAFGWLRASNDVLDQPEALRARLDEDGYLFLPGVLDADLVGQARDRLLERLETEGVLDIEAGRDAGIAKTSWNGKGFHQLFKENEPLQRLQNTGRMIELYENLLEGPVRRLDFAWMRVMGPGPGTAPHADTVYMNRGTHRLFTSWTPLMEIPLDVGGLIVMPGSHRLERLAKSYFQEDVDKVCTNHPARRPRGEHGWVGPVGDGKLTKNPVALQRGLKLPWLTAETYRPGDVVIFHIYTVHGSLDNRSARVRLSMDTRFQRAEDPADERWIGENPVGHGPGAKRHLIC